ncbi:astacin-like metalloendopeptidase [Leucoraja erinacea]|uniref:astacin-like metalloendopeptidase n=1 Tax=Leucoraja erinaceus TaxID=7782 RepID=UPI002455DFD7|nr:astacin-like metalloendopeptidase [Leucoraja erinacea]
MLRAAGRAGNARREPARGEAPGVAWTRVPGNLPSARLGGAGRGVGLFRCIITTLVNYVNSTSQAVQLQRRGELGLPMLKPPAGDDDLNKLQSETNEADIFSMILKANKELLESTGNKKIEHGDIVLDNSRNAMICRRSPKSCLWPSSEDRNVYVPYRLSRDYDNSERRTIKRSLHEIATFTCVKFYEPRRHKRAFVSVTAGAGCYAIVGFTGQQQILSLNQRSCLYFGIIEHEFLHSIGFQHEHCRSDRDSYIRILWQNVMKNQAFNFDKLRTNNLGTKYDYTSIMHYGRYAFSKNRFPTLEPVDPNARIGQIRGLTTLDAYKINKLYNCDVCGQILNSKIGSITSPNFPGLYPNNLNCNWLIRIMDPYKIFLEFSVFRVHETGQCHDHLTIYDGANEHAHILDGPTCGAENPAVISKRNELLITFFSNWRSQAPGFVAAYKLTQCGITKKGKIGRVQSMSRLSLHNRCFWVVLIERNHQVVLQLESFTIEESPNCTKSSLTIHDAARTPPTIAGMFCGKMKLPLLWTSFGRTVVIEFHYTPSAYIRQFKIRYHSIKSKCSKYTSL